MSTEVVTPSPAPSVLVIPPEGGRPISAFGSTALFKIEGRHTGGALCLAIATTPPGVGPPPHVHRRDDELFVELEGELSFLTSTGWVAAPQGSVVFVPRGAPHTFRNSGSTPSRHLVVNLPSGFDEFFERCGEVQAAGGPPDVARLRAIAAEYGYEFLAPGQMQEG